MIYFISKLLSVVPSCFIISDVYPSSPPIRMVPSCSTLQHTCPSLYTWRLWLVRAQAPVAGLNCSQLVAASLLKVPPHASSPAWLWLSLASSRLTASWHEAAVAGRKTSADWRPGSPPAAL